MKLKYFQYNAFLIEDEETKIAIDPGLNLWLFKMRSLIPKKEWETITHILVTYGDPDHFAYAVPMAKKSGATVVCGEALMEDFLSYNVEDVYKIDVCETVKVKNLTVEGLNTKHGPLPVKLFFGLIKLEKENVDFARGSIGFKITIGDKSVVNLGDTVLLKEWEGLKPDVLMVPIGGRVTMDEKEALEAVRLIEPKKVVPCHYNCDFLWKRNVIPADDEMFMREVEKMGITCHIMQYGDEIDI